MKEFVPISAGYEKARASERPRNGMEDRTTEGRAISLTLYTGRPVPQLVRPIMGEARAPLSLDLDDVSLPSISSAIADTCKSARRKKGDHSEKSAQREACLGKVQERGATECVPGRAVGVDPLNNFAVAPRCAPLTRVARVVRPGSLR